MSAAATFFGCALPGILLAYIYYESDVRIVRWPMEVSHFPAFRDFSNLWAGGIAALHQQFFLLFNQAAHDAQLAKYLGIPSPGLIWSYPPTALLPAVPFGLLPFGIAAALWTLLGLVAYVFAAGLKDVSAKDRMPWLAALALSPGVFLCVAYGQTAFYTSAAIIVGLVEAKRKPLVAGLCLALLAAKPQMALAIPVVLLAMRAWRALGFMILFGAIYVLATFLAFGVEPWKLFFETTLPSQMEIMTMSRFDPVLMSSPYFMLRGLGLSQTSSYQLQALISVAALAWLFAAIRAEKDGNMQILLAASATLILSAYMRIYELPLLTAAVARICAGRESVAHVGRTNLKVLIAAATLVPLILWFAALFGHINAIALVPMSLLVFFGWRAIASGEHGPIAQRVFALAQGARRHRALLPLRPDNP